MSHTTSPLAFTGLINLAAEAVGAEALYTNDDFFAGIDNLVKPGRGIFIDGKFTDRGKWMDGWESRRKRGVGYDYCVVRLGCSGVVKAIDIDTNHFLGNHAPIASVEGCHMPHSADRDALQAATWWPLLPQSPLRPGAQNLFVCDIHNSTDPMPPVTHVRLNIFPDGGVARLRVYGTPTAEAAQTPDDTTLPLLKHGEFDAVAAQNGGQALLCSDAFFGPLENLILPGRAATMGDGWETRRRRGPVLGHDWILLKLGRRAKIRLIEVDTNHFKGNFPDQCSVDILDTPSEELTEIASTERWQPLLPKAALQAHHRHFFTTEVCPHDAGTHIRLSIFPDGGISRLRLWGSATG